MGNLHFFSNQGSWLNPMMKNPHETSDGLSREEIITRNGWAKTSPFVIPDDLDDVLGGLLRRLNTMPTWTKEKMTLYGEIEASSSKAIVVGITFSVRETTACLTSLWIARCVGSIPRKAHSVDL